MVLAENRQFHKFIILTMMLPFTHDSAIRWGEIQECFTRDPNVHRKAGVHVSYAANRNEPGNEGKKRRLSQHGIPQQIIDAPLEKRIEVEWQGGPD
jgi:hypothetical protein